MQKKPVFVREQIQLLSDVKVKTWNIPQGSQLQMQLTQEIALSNKLLNTPLKGGGIPQETVFPLLQCFDSIEHTIYQWFTQQQSPAQEQYALFLLLRQLQENHKVVVSRQIELDLPPWIPIVSPGENLDEVVQLWHSITQRDGDGAFRVENETAGLVAKAVPPQAHKDLQNDLFASLARLITRPVGRRLLRLAYTQGRTGKAVHFLLNPTSYALGGISPMASPDGVGADCQWNVDALTGNVIGLMPNVGSSGQMSYIIGLTDADMMDFDKANRLLPSPVFIGLGHELIHIAHYQYGTYMSNAAHYSEVANVYQQLFPTIAQQNLPPAYQGGGSLEEFLTIPDHAEQLYITATQ